MLAIAMGEEDAGETELDRGGDRNALDQLVNAFLSSTEVWAAHNREGQPCALWGVGPISQDHDVGRFWLLTCEEVETAPHDLAALSIIVLPEMLASYARLESIVDARLGRLLLVGLEPAALHEPSGRLCHRVWIEADAAFLAPRPRPTLLN